MTDSEQQAAPDLRVCRICGTAKPLTTQYFERSCSKPGKTQLRLICRPCRHRATRDRQKELREHPERRKNAKLHKLRTIVVISDVHVPIHDRRYWSVLCQILKAAKPHELVINGDFLELECMSMHGNAILTTLGSELEAGNAAIDQLRYCAGDNCEITYLEGNHETRLARWIDHTAPQLRDTLSIPAGLRLAERRIKWITEAQQPIVRGSLRIVHGHQIAGRFGQKYHAAKAVERYGSAGMTVLIGHHHRDQVVTTPAYHALGVTSDRGFSRGVAMGCGRDFAAPWTHGNVNGWSLQIAIAHVRPDGVTALQLVDVVNGAAVWNGRLWTVVTDPIE